MTRHMLASLPMYDPPSLHAATDAWWHGLARHMRAAGVSGVPAQLSRNPEPAWTDARLLFSQSCGYPLTHELDGRVGIVCTPAYSAPGCDGAHYASAIVVRATSTAHTLADLRGTTCAFSDTASHSGYNILRRMVAPLAAEEGCFFADAVATGSHAASLAAVAGGEADVCAVDGVTHALFARHEPERLVGTRVLTLSPKAPGLPCIAGPGVSDDDRLRMRDAVFAAAADPALADTRGALLIADVEVIERPDYDAIVDMEREAQALGYPHLV